MIKAIVVDDEKQAQDLLCLLLDEYFDDVEVIGVASSALEGIKLIQKGHPDVLFLDVQMPHGSGFDLLESIPDRKFEVVFTSAHQEFALKAIKEEAKDFLVKPIDIDDLEAAINRIRKNRKEVSDTADITSKIQIPFNGGIRFIAPTDIIHAEGDGNYTTLFLEGGEKMVVTKNMKMIEQMLPQQGFFRSHNSHLINLSYVQEFNRSDGGYVVMSNGTHVPLSRRKREEFIVLLKG